MRERRQLGMSDVSVTTIGCGTAAIGGLYAQVSPEQAQAMLEAAWSGGIRYFDTAPHYGAGLAEQRLGAFVAQLPRDELVVSTKVGRRLVPPRERPLDREAFVGGLELNREWDFSGDGVLKQVEDSLERLGLSRVDVLLIHDPDDHIDEAMTGAYPALHSLREQGVVGAIGVGVKSAELAARFVRECSLDVVMLAGRYTLLEQGAADSLLPLCLDKAVAVIVAGVFNSGVLVDPSPHSYYEYVSAPEAVVARALRLQDICARHGQPLGAAALQFPAMHPAVTSVVIGPRDPEEVAVDLGFADSAVSTELWDALHAEGVRRADGGRS